MKAMPMIAMGMLAIGLIACQGSHSSKTSPPSQTMASSQPTGNEVRDVKQPATSPAAALETNAESPAAKQMAQEMRQEQPKAAETTASAKPAATTPTAPVAQAPKPVAPAPVAKPVTGAPKQMAASMPVGNAANGEKIAGKCKACHNFNDKKKVGPGLAGVFGRKAGRMAGMSYSDSLQKANWSWDASHLATWVCDSAAAVKKFSGNAAAKTKMPPQHVCDPKQQADLIAFLKTL